MNPRIETMEKHEHERAFLDPFQAREKKSHELLKARGMSGSSIRGGEYFHIRMGAMAQWKRPSTMNRPWLPLCHPTMVRLEWQAEVDLLSLSLSPRRKGGNPGDQHWGTQGRENGEEWKRRGRFVQCSRVHGQSKQSCQRERECYS